MPKDLVHIWQSVQATLTEAGDTLSGELAAALEQLDALRADLEAEFREVKPLDAPPDRVESLQLLYENVEKSPLFKPLAERRAVRGRQRALEAFNEYLRSLGDLTAATPLEVRASDKEIVKALGGRAVRSGPTAWLRRGDQERRLTPRAAVERTISRRRSRLLKDAGEALLRLAELDDALLDPWEAVLADGQRRLEGSTASSKELDHDRQRWIRAGTRSREKAVAALGALQQTHQALLHQMAVELAREPRRKFGRAVKPPADRTAECVAYWTRRRQGAALQFDLGVLQTSLGVRLAEIAERALEALEGERTQLVAELEQLANSLRAWDGGLDPGFLVSVRAEVRSASERTSDWADEARRAAAELLPEEAELCSSGRALPSWWVQWRMVKPLEALQRGLEAGSRPTLLGGFSAAEQAHRSIVSEIDQARRVVLYGLEAAADESEPGMAQEAVKNAERLIERRLQQLPESRALVEPSLVQASAGALGRCSAAVAEGRFGLFRKLARQRAPRLLSQAANTTVVTLRRALQYVWNLLTQLNRWTLIRIGWARPLESHLNPVEWRPRLGEGVPRMSATDLPLLYRRLFRPEPVSDPRFLVGRRIEMNALLQCRRDWEADSPTAVLIVGERGSGKTSLINCARVGAFEGLPAVTGAFRERVVDAQGMDAFLRDLFGLANDEDIVEALQRERRLVILEELERTFLRSIGGFDGLKRLLSVVAKTKRSVLWCLAINQAGFKLVTAAVGIERVFSHRVNARAVSAEQLREAILQRHDLSGLMLRFQPQGHESGIRRVQASLGLEHSLQDDFFAALHDQSHGVFRSAFQLWRAAMISTGGDYVRLQQPEPPNTTALQAALDLQDLFTLQAVLQHGALKPAEHARIFAASSDDSLDRLTRLGEMGMLEAEQETGLKVRPGAGHLVRSILDSNNLL